MSFAQVPARMAGYATYELAVKLAALTPQQREAVGRIVQHVYLDNRQWSQLFTGEDRICAEANYYRRGAIDPTTGGWAKRPGWGHDKEFQDALGEATRLALQSKSREEMDAVATARRRARLATGAVIGEMITIATKVQDQVLPSGRVVSIARGAEDKDSIAAANILLRYAAVDVAEQGQGEQSEEDDWWKAAEGTE